MVPCHHITLDAEGDTIKDLEADDNESRLARKVSDWLRTKIKELEEERTTQALAGCP